LKYKRFCSCGNITYSGSICQKCKGYKRPKDVCYKCGELKSIVYRKDNPVCRSCYNSYYRQKKICKSCNIMSLINSNGLCKKCYKTKKKICSVCNKLKSVHIKKEVVCKDCYSSWRSNKDEEFSIIRRLRWRVRDAFKSYLKTGKIRKTDEYEINYKEIIAYLGNCPGNLCDYHIDHIKPISKFDFNDPEQIKLAFAPENHQWLTKEENLKKSNK